MATAPFSESSAALNSSLNLLVSVRWSSLSLIALLLHFSSLLLFDGFFLLVLPVFVLVVDSKTTLALVHGSLGLYVLS